MPEDLWAAGWVLIRKRMAWLMRSAGIRARGRCRRRCMRNWQYAYPLATHQLSPAIYRDAPIESGDRYHVFRQRRRVGVCGPGDGGPDSTEICRLGAESLYRWWFKPWLRCAWRSDATLVHHFDRGMQYAAADRGV